MEAVLGIQLALVLTTAPSHVPASPALNRPTVPMKKSQYTAKQITFWLGRPKKLSQNCRR